MAEDRAHNPARKPLVSEALARAFQVTKGMNPEEAADQVQAWNAKFKGKERSPRQEGTSDVNSTNSMGD